MKPIKQLVPDLEKALDKSLQMSAHTIANDLVKSSPWWDGVFADNWKIYIGQKTVVPNFPGKRLDDKTASKQRTPRNITTVAMPALSKLKGYTIGNVTTYREVAMDLKAGLPTFAGALRR